MVKLEWFLSWVKLFVWWTPSHIRHPNWKDILEASRDKISSLIKNIRSRRKRRTTRKTLLNLDPCNNDIHPLRPFFVFFFSKSGDLAHPHQKIDIVHHFLLRLHACLDMANKEHNKHVCRPITWSRSEKDLNQKDLNYIEICIYSEAMCIIFFKKMVTGVYEELDCLSALQTLAQYSTYLKNSSI